MLQAVILSQAGINQALHGIDVTQQEEIDDIMITLDGTENKEKLGANALLAVSSLLQKPVLPLVVYRCINISEITRLTMFLPVPMMNIINGGAHADNNIDFQEFMILPVGAPTFSDADARAPKSSII